VLCWLNKNYYFFVLLLVFFRFIIKPVLKFHDAQVAGFVAVYSAGLCALLTCCSPG
jgi:hypothetical protein